MSDALFGSDPARDSRFVVKERWIDCDNFAGDHPLHKVQFFHRQMNEEIDSLEASAQALADFPDAAWPLRMQLARQCADEARHAQAYRARVECHGGHVGQFPVLNFQYRIITARGDLISRLVIQNRSFEAGGLDAIAYGVEEARKIGDNELADFYEAQLADEISHVRFANEWIRKALKEDPRTLLRMGVSLNAAAQAFRKVMGTEGTEGADYPAAVQARLDAGFTEDEVRQAV
ncbi:MAG TPA: DUF455 family protein, partial [Burkholderiaceae bacterium]|nr:DUF455 family protein [Burkholderiaceae bacterium]